MRTRPVDMYVMVQDVQPGDMINGVTVETAPQPFGESLWEVIAGSWRNSGLPENPYIRLLLPQDHPVAIRRRIPVPDGKCINCGKRPIKYANLELCNACYAMLYRASKKAPEDHFEAVTEMMPEHAREIYEPRIRLVT